MHKDAVHAHVEAVNNANRWAHHVSAVLQRFFKPYVGQVVFNADGSLKKKIQAELDPVTDFVARTDIDIYRQSGSDLVWTVKACENYDAGSEIGMYHTASVYVGNCKGNTLENLYHPFKGRYDWTAEELIQKRAILNDALKAVDEARSALGPFGLFDR